MPLLNFEMSEPKHSGSKKPLKLILGIGALVGTIALGSTLAASINLNSGDPVEFGQGVAQTTACDDQVKVTPVSSFSNSEESGFKFTAITLSELDGTIQEDSTDKGCASKTFTIKAYDSSGYLLTPTFSISLDGSGNFSSPDGDTNGSNEGQTDSSVTLDFASPSISAELVYRITIESSASSSSAIDGNSIFVGTDGSPNGITQANLNGEILSIDFAEHNAYASMFAIDDNYLYWNDGEDIFKSPLTDPTDRTFLFTFSFDCWINYPGGLAIDSTYIYFSNTCTSKIGRAKLDGSEINDSFIVGTNGSGWTSGDNDIYGLYVTNDKIYWANYTTNTIGRADIDGSNQNNDFINIKSGSYTGYDSSVGGICGITIQGGYIYWTNYDIHTIGRANIDGTGKDNSYISTGSGTSPYFITSNSSKLYWTNYSSGNVMQANFDGSGKTVLFSKTQAIGIAVSTN